MKQVIEAPWSIGDIGWIVLERSNKKVTHCETCNHPYSESSFSSEVLECEIDSIDITLKKDGPSYWYRVAVDIGECDKYEGKFGRFTYGTQVSEVFASRKEAEASIKKEVQS